MTWEVVWALFIVLTFIAVMTTIILMHSESVHENNIAELKAQKEHMDAESKLLKEKNREAEYYSKLALREHESMVFSRGLRDANKAFEKEGI